MFAVPANVVLSRTEPLSSQRCWRWIRMILGVYWGHNAFEWWDFDRKTGRHSRSCESLLDLMNCVWVCVRQVIRKLFGWKGLVLWADAESGWF